VQPSVDLLQRLALVGVALVNTLKNGLPWDLTTHDLIDFAEPEQSVSPTWGEIEPQLQTHLAPAASVSLSPGL
jgi:hypothetical protein